MDTNLLRNWLGLPPGDWPPDANVLLGPGTANVQERALALMERLRPHQLRHPELVTEGMNRLAQALIEVERIPANDSIEAENLASVESAVLSGVVLDAEVIEAFPVLDASAVIAQAPPKPRRKPRAKPASEPAVVVPVVEQVQPMLLGTDRRQSYRQLVSTRAARRGWQRLSPYLGVPNEPLVTSADIFRFLDAVVELRRALNLFEQLPVQAGTLSRSVVVHGSCLALFRSLQKTQRDLLAADWANGLAELQGTELALRSNLKATKPRRTIRQRFRSGTKWAARHPEWVLLVTMLLTIAIAGYQSVR